MKLKDKKFAILAENKNSIAHKWFKENVDKRISWTKTNCYYIHIIKSYGSAYGVLESLQLVEKKYPNIQIYTEVQFEILIFNEMYGKPKSKLLDFNHY